MAVNSELYLTLADELKQKNVVLVAVSKTKPIEDILELYHLGQRDFGENYIQELSEKQKELPADIRWHFIGHLQTNKVKVIAPFIHLIHGVDSLKLLLEINKQGLKNNRIIDCLLQVHIAQEETKFGFNEDELDTTINQLPDMQLNNVKISGLMGMASFTEDQEKIKDEFHYLKSFFDKYAQPLYSMQTLSMGMSSDYKIAIDEGSNMVRIGSLLFGERAYIK
ncbi:MAG TPA: YggS family pyridoxal phosphate-dependent enzyme [Panacibacter sp.]|nr:YggS family pyridoxal phosphate-dependent enzyme [Panacibacter sp.]